MTDISDIELLQKIATGNQQALKQFYQRFSGCVYQFSMRSVANAADAADVVNEVMLEVWRRAHTFQGKSQVRTWLLSITRNKSIDLLRRKRPNQSLDDIELIEEGDGHCELSFITELKEQGAQVRSCMDKLKDTHRQVVYLTFFEELSYTDIADVMAIPSGTVKTRMMHAKQQLLKCLQRFLGE